MLKANLNKEIEIEICSDWSDLTIRTCVELYKIADRFPDNVKRLYNLRLEEQSDTVIEQIAELEQSITNEQRIKFLPNLYGDIILLLTSIEKSIVDRLSPDQRTNFYNQYLSKFVLGVLVFPIDLQVQNIESFELDGTVYQLPRTRRFNIGQHQISEPMSDSSILEFTESADFQLATANLEGGRMDTLANICGILCRPKGESYNENVALQRATYFMDNLTMDKAWEVFFCLIEHFSILKKRSQISLNIMELRKEMTDNFNNFVGMVKSSTLQKKQRK